MRKYDCRRTEDYVHEFTRLCKTYENKCTDCPMYIFSCTRTENITTEMIAVLQKWSDEHIEAPTITEEERAFLKSFLTTNDKCIARASSGLYLFYDNTGIKLCPSMFTFIEEGKKWTMDELLKLEVTWR